MASRTTLGPPAAIANAVADAFRPLDVAVNRVPIRPEALLELIDGAKSERAPVEAGS